MWRVYVVVGLSSVLAGGCRSAPGAIEGAAVMTALGATAAGVNRATGGCYASCAPGSVCDPETGLCRRVSCGVCPSGHVCDTLIDPPRCVLRVEAQALIPPEDPSRYGVPDSSPPPPIANDYFRASRPGPPRSVPALPSLSGALGGQLGPTQSATVAPADVRETGSP